MTELKKASVISAHIFEFKKPTVLYDLHYHCQALGGGGEGGGKRQGC